MNYEESRYIASVGGSDNLRREDVAPLKAGVQQVLEIMQKGAWVTIPDLRKQINQEGADRRMRELRQAGYQIEKRRIANSRLYEYRLKMPQIQGGLF